MGGGGLAHWMGGSMRWGDVGRECRTCLELLIGVGKLLELFLVLGHFGWGSLDALVAELRV